MDEIQELVEIFTEYMEKGIEIEKEKLVKEHMVNRFSFLLSSEKFIADDKAMKEMLVAEVNTAVVLTIEKVISNPPISRNIADYEAILQVVDRIHTSDSVVLLRHDTNLLLSLMMQIEARIYGKN